MAKASRVFVMDAESTGRKKCIDETVRDGNVRLKWSSLLARLLPVFESPRGQWLLASSPTCPARYETPVESALPTGGRFLIWVIDIQGRRTAMSDTVPSKEQKLRRLGFLRVPLFRLLAINLAAGTALAVFLVGGLLALNPSGLRDLILADRSPGTALGLLLFGFVVTFGSTAMGTAIMAAGQRKADDETPRGRPRLVAQASTRPVRH
jgi:hypothetical protein